MDYTESILQLICHLVSNTTLFWVCSLQFTRSVTTSCYNHATVSNNWFFS